MQITKKDLEKNQVELTIEVSVEEIKPHLEKAAQKISAQHKLPGFRPGKAPLEMVKNKFGEMMLLQEALDFVISDSYFKAITREKLEAVGQPQINVEKMAPNNPIVYKAIVSLLPKVTLGEWQKEEVKRQEAKATQEDIDKTLEQLATMNVKETVADRISKKGDKVEVDFEVLIDKVVIEGGKNHKYPVVLGENKMIPGFEDHLVGLKAKDKKEFELKFPDKYFEKNLAGKLATFKVEVVAVYEREMPKLDDTFAKTIGFESLTKLKEQLEQNITQDKELKERQRLEGELISALVKSATIGDVPENLIENEIHKMSHELEHNIRSQGMDMAGYLKSINKTQEDLKKDFKPQALERIKAALVLRQLSIEEKLKVEEKEIDQEIAKQKETYKGNQEATKNIEATNYRQYLANMMTNQKVIDFITDKIVK
ncbi:trigger factor [Patescibacteria group bacterium]|nr:trigger factor [Patescibacteria group bacterium]